MTDAQMDPLRTSVVKATLAGWLVPVAFAAIGTSVPSVAAFVPQGAFDVALPSTVAAALALVALPVALRANAGAMARALPFWLVTLALFAAPGAASLRALRVGRDVHEAVIFLGFGAAAYAEVLAALHVAAGLTAVAALACAVGFAVQRDPSDRLGGLPLVFVALAVAAGGSSISSNLLHVDLAQLLEHGRLEQLRAGEASQVETVTRLVALVVGVGAALAGGSAASGPAVRLTTPALLLVLVGLPLADRAFLARVADVGRVDRRAPPFVLPVAAGARKAGTFPGYGAVPTLTPDGLRLRDGSLVAAERAALAAFLAREQPDLDAPPRTDEGGDVVCAGRTLRWATFVVAATDATSRDQLLVLLGAAEDARYSAVQFVGRDPHARFLAGDGPLTHVIPPALVSATVLLPAAREACPPRHRDTRVAPFPYARLAELFVDPSTVGVHAPGALLRTAAVRR